MVALGNVGRCFRKFRMYPGFAGYVAAYGDMHRFADIKKKQKYLKGVNHS